MESTRGKLLIASPRLVDPNFARAVVLMVQHNDQGALGLILNRPLETTMRQVCQKSLGEDFQVEGVLHQGGPCEGPLMVVHDDSQASDADVLPGIFFTTERSKIESLLRDGNPSARYFIGYAGWGPGQLESEMEHDSWLVVEAETGFVFVELPNLWTKLLTRCTLGRHIDPSRIPDDPSVN